MIRAWEGNGTPRTLLAESYHEDSPTISPNSRWMAYTSYVSGTAEVYVRSFPDMGPVTKISIDVGIEPRWRPDGEAIFSRSRLGLHEVEVLEGIGGLVPGSRSNVDATVYRRQANAAAWDVHPDGDRFIFVSATTTTGASYQITLNATTRPGGR